MPESTITDPFSSATHAASGLAVGEFRFHVVDPIVAEPWQYQIFLEVARMVKCRDVGPDKNLGSSNVPTPV